MANPRRSPSSSAVGHLLRADPRSGHALEAGDEFLVKVEVGNGGDVVEPDQLVFLYLDVVLD